MDGFPARHLGARLAIGRRQCSQAPGGRAPSPSRAGFLYIKSGPRGVCSSGALEAAVAELLGTVLLSLLRPAHCQPSPELRGLPAGTMRGSELPLLLLALVLCQAPRGPAAPVSAGASGSTVLAKMYPRGSHWAVGKCPDCVIPGPFSSEGLVG